MASSVALIGVGVSLIGPSTSVSEFFVCESVGDVISAGDSCSAGGGVGCCIGAVNDVAS